MLGTTNSRMTVDIVTPPMMSYIVSVCVCTGLIRMYILGPNNFHRSDTCSRVRVTTKHDYVP